MRRVVALAAVSAGVLLGAVVVDPPAAQAAAGTAPHPVTGLVAFQTLHPVTLDWHRMTQRVRTIVRVQRGRTAPASPAQGRRVPVVRHSATMYHLAPNTVYSAAVWTARDGRLSRSATTTFTTRAASTPTSIAGTVTDRSGRRLRGALVGVVNLVTGDVRIAHSDASGRYRVAGPPGRYSVQVLGQNASGGASDATGYQPEGIDLVATAGRTTVAPTVALLRGGAVTGRITDSSGRPLAGVPVSPQPSRAYLDATTGGQSILFDSASTPVLTRRDGTYTLRGVAPGSQLACAATAQGRVTGGRSDGAGYVPSCGTRAFDVAPGGHADLDTLALVSASGGSVAGRVIDALGRPVRYSLVTVGNRRDQGYAETGGYGLFRVNGLAPGTYSLCAQPGQLAVVGHVGSAAACGSVVVGDGRISHAALRLPSGAALGGRVLGPTGLPLRNVGVSVSRDRSASAGTSSSAVTDSLGHFVVRNLAPGRYHVCFDPTGPSAGTPTGAVASCFRGSRTTVYVRPGAVRIGIDTRLGAGGAIAGRVTDTAHHGVRNANLLALSLSDSDNFGGEGTAGADGRYLVTNLPRGRYSVCAFPDYGGFDDFACTNGFVTVRRAAVHRRLDLVLPQQTSLTVHVRDTAGHPLAGVDVAVLGRCAQGGCASQPVFGTTPVDVADSEMTAANGSITMHSIAPGRYAVCSLAYYAASAAGSPATGYADRCSGTTFTVTLARGRSTVVTQTLTTAGAITGRVVDSAGRPIRNALVQVDGSAATDFRNVFTTPTFDDGTPQGDALTNADGSYTLHSVAAGNRKVCVDATEATSARGGRYKNGCLATAVPIVAGATSTAPPLVLTAGTLRAHVSVPAARATPHVSSFGPDGYALFRYLTARQARQTRQTRQTRSLPATLMWTRAAELREWRGAR